MPASKSSKTPSDSAQLHRTGRPERLRTRSGPVRPVGASRESKACCWVSGTAGIAQRRPCAAPMNAEGFEAISCDSSGESSLGTPIRACNRARATSSAALLSVQSWRCALVRTRRNELTVAKAGSESIARFRARRSSNTMLAPRGAIAMAALSPSPRRTPRGAWTSSMNTSYSASVIRATSSNPSRNSTSRRSSNLKPGMGCRFTSWSVFCSMRHRCRRPARTSTGCPVPSRLMTTLASSTRGPGGRWSLSKVKHHLLRVGIPAIERSPNIDEIELKHRSNLLLRKQLSLISNAG